jgi:hypothetical protein
MVRTLPLVAVAVCFAIVLLCFANVLYPPIRRTLAQPPFNLPAPRPPPVPIGMVLDGNRKPVAGATIAFRDTQTGRNTVTFVTDSHGTFRWKDMSGILSGRFAPVGLLLSGHISHRRIAGPGMVLPRNLQHEPVFWFSAPAGYRVTFKDNRGKPVPGLTVSLGQARTPQLTDRTGTIIFPARPAALREERIRIADDTYFLTGQSRGWNGKEVHYQVTVTPAAVITGRVALPDGSPARGYMVSAFLRGPRKYLGTTGHGITGPRGRFRIGGLEPGEYGLYFSLREEKGWISPVNVPRSGTKVEIGDRTLNVR